ncbi:unnamed protein product [Effrenium voratum]|uniref:Uncharacterized protein n=1 Tax=Effrenium voratum TaxID=2562239 RepID=A0AA36IGC8_9DINO|nr:unnamed protein product [Effrenium voratum]
MSSRTSPGPPRPVVSRVKLPQPGRGQVRVADITAGSGCADPASRSGSARSLAARSVPTPNLDSSPGPSAVRHVRTPELRSGTLTSSRSMHRSNSENVLARSSPHATVPEALVSGSHSLSRGASQCSEVFEASLPAASVWTDPVPAEPVARDLPAPPRARPALERQPSAREREGPRDRERERPQSEPPKESRLPELLEEIEDHLLRQTVRPPADASRWQQETAQLALYAEEIRKLLLPLEASQLSAEPRSHSRGRRKSRELSKVKPRELSVLRGDKDLRWARQQLKNCEKEYQHLQQLLGGDQQQLLVELREVEGALENEKRKLKGLEKESHKRERSLARAAARAGGGELGLLTLDGNRRAKQEVERLEAELEVWQMKNSSLMKQLEETNSRLQQALQGKEAQEAKHQRLLAKLDSEDTKKRLADEQQRQEQQHEEEQRLREEIRSLQKARSAEGAKVERLFRERLKGLEELRRRQAEQEAQLAQLKATETQLRRLEQKEVRRKSKAEQTLLPTPLEPPTEVTEVEDEPVKQTEEAHEETEVQGELQLEATGVQEEESLRGEAEQAAEVQEAREVEGEHGVKEEMEEEALKQEEEEEPVRQHEVEEHGLQDEGEGAEMKEEAEEEMREQEIEDDETRTEEAEETREEDVEEDEMRNEQAEEAVREEEVEEAEMGNEQAEEAVREEEVEEAEMGNEQAEEAVREEEVEEADMRKEQSEEAAREEEIQEDEMRKDDVNEEARDEVEGEAREGVKEDEAREEVVKAMSDTEVQQDEGVHQMKAAEDKDLSQAEAEDPREARRLQSEPQQAEPPRPRERRSVSASARAASRGAAPKAESRACLPTGSASAAPPEAAPAALPGPRDEPGHGPFRTPSVWEASCGIAEVGPHTSWGRFWGAKAKGAWTPET